MVMRRLHGSSERGFTLPEVLVTIAILGILFGIAMSVWNSVVESRRVDSAANQLASDMRLAHNRATNQLTDWRVVVVLNRGGKSAGADYYLMKLQEPYDGNNSPAMEGDPIARTFPANVKARQPDYQDDQAADYFLLPPQEAPAPPSTLTFEFDPDGSMNTYGGVSGSACVTVDTDPELRTYVQAATSRVEVRDKECDDS